MNSITLPDRIFVTLTDTRDLMARSVEGLQWGPMSPDSTDMAGLYAYLETDSILLLVDFMEDHGLLSDTVWS